MDYPMSDDPVSLIRSVKPKTFCDDFAEQLEIAEMLYGSRVTFSFGYNDVEKIVDSASIYDAEVRKRVIDVVMQMRRRYEYLFR